MQFTILTHPNMMARNSAKYINILPKQLGAKVV